jgi:hypothetical protein
MFFNEDIHSDVDTVVQTGRDEQCARYNAFDNRIEKAECDETGLRLKLSPYESNIFVFGEVGDSELFAPPAKVQPVTLDLLYDIDIKAATADKYTPFKKNNRLFNITGSQGINDFSGYIRYTANFELDDAKYNYLDLGTVYETAVVHLNGKLVGSRISRPYEFDISDSVKKGRNVLQVEVVNNPAHKERDRLSCFLAIPPSGMFGPVRLL